MENRFNLIDEPWIPIVDKGRVSLLQVFSDASLTALGGSATQKMAVMKLLLAIVQAASPVESEKDWRLKSVDQLAQDVRDYLVKWHDRFYLYGDKPFLQMPAIHHAEVKSFGTISPEVATGNTTIVMNSQIENQLSDAEKAVVLVQQMAFSLAGKKVDNSVTLTPGYNGKKNEKGKPSSGKAGPATGFGGYLHTMLMAQSLLGTLHLNQLTEARVKACGLYPDGVGTAPWEQMPAGECCPVAQTLQRTLMGRLVPLSRFCLFSEDGQGVHFSEGIQHPDYKSGGIDPTISIDRRGKDPRVLWTRTDKRPWRELSSLLSFLSSSGKGGVETLQLSMAVERVKGQEAAYTIWSAGLSLSQNAGEHFASGQDDYVDSTLPICPRNLGEDWFLLLTETLEATEDISKALYAAISHYRQDMGNDSKSAKPVTQKALASYWRSCEAFKRDIVASCDTTEKAQALRSSLRRRLIATAMATYDQACPNGTARQIAAWAKNKPNLSRFLPKEVA